MAAEAVDSFLVVILGVVWTNGGPSVVEGLLRGRLEVVLALTRLLKDVTTWQCWRVFASHLILESTWTTWTVYRVEAYWTHVDLTRYLESSSLQKHSGR